MLKSKLFEGLREYLDQYLFGFDPSQMDLSLLKGNVTLSDVNVRPDRVNKLLSGSLMIPFTLKAGTISRLDLNLSLLQMWAAGGGPMEITIDELFLVMSGPSPETYISHDDSYI